jgi:ubiquinone/menaquinone biosynthesis C-methylase UbiE/uncharacterized protein YbaR (Trm112 family)
MKKAVFDNLLPLLACPNCHGELVPEGLGGGDEVLLGTLRCASCAMEYPIREEAIYLIVPDASWKCVLQEAVSWKSHEKEQEFLTASGLQPPGSSAAEEYHSMHEGERHDSFEKIISGIGIAPGTRACEVAAFQCVQAQYISRLGADVVATDAWPEPMLYGAGRVCREFPRIICNAARLPFHSGAFDLTYERTAIHHFEDMGSAIREMGRVTRPGGRIALIHEPSHYIFGTTSNEKASGEDLAFLMGFNEQSPQFISYLKALFSANVRDITVHCSNPYFSAGVARLLARIGVNHTRLIATMFGTGITRGLWILKHALVHCGISVVAIKGRVSPPPPPPVPRERFLFTIEEFMDRGLENLTRLWKRTIPEEEIASEVIVGENDLFHLRRGWEKSDIIYGRSARWTRYIAYFFMKRTDGADTLEIECSAPVGKLGAPVSAEASVDGGPWQQFSVVSECFEKYRIELPPSRERIAEVRIRTPRPWRMTDVFPGKHDRRIFCGIAVSRIALVR